MTDPNLSLFASNSHESDSPRQTPSFQRIQVNRPQRQPVREYQDLPRPNQQELLSRLIDAVREL